MRGRDLNPLYRTSPNPPRPPPNFVNFVTRGTALNVQRLMACDVAVGIDLHLHGSLLS